MIKNEYTREEAEALGRCMYSSDGYMYFAKNFMKVTNPIEGLVKFDPSDEQKRLLKSYHDNKHSVNKMDRQTGKTTCTAIYLLWYAMFNPNQNILVVTHNDNSALNFRDLVIDLFSRCPNYLCSSMILNNREHIDFENGSKIVVTTFSDHAASCGLSFSVLYCDEYAFWNSSCVEEFWKKVMPRMSFDPRIIITSSEKRDDELPTFENIWKAANGSKYSRFGRSFYPFDGRML